MMIFLILVWVVSINIINLIGAIIVYYMTIMKEKNYYGGGTDNYEPW